MKKKEKIYVILMKHESGLEIFGGAFKTLQGVYNRLTDDGDYKLYRYQNNEIRGEEIKDADGIIPGICLMRVEVKGKYIPVSMRTKIFVKRTSLRD